MQIYNVINFLVSLQCANSAWKQKDPQRMEKKNVCKQTANTNHTVCQGRLAQVTINSQFDAHMAHSGLRIESRCVRDIFCLIIKYRTPWSSHECDVNERTNKRMLITCSYLINKNDSPTLYKRLSPCSLAMTFILLRLFCLVLLQAKPVHCVFNFLEIIKLLHLYVVAV